jgi:hypothetical protein
MTIFIIILSKHFSFLPQSHPIVKDKRYTAVKKLIQSNDIAQFGDIFEFVPMSVVALDSKINYSTLYRKNQDVRKFNLGDVEKLAEVLEVDFLDLVTIIKSSMDNKKSKRNK